MSHKYSGSLISFEGIDFCGKSTQIKLVEQYLNDIGCTVSISREPGGTEISEKIRDLLKDKENFQMTSVCELFLFSAARNQVINEKIIPLLQRGNIILMDRFYDSTIAYQGYGRGIDLENIIFINKIATGGLTPDITFWLDISLEEVVKRQQSQERNTDRMEDSGKEFYKRVIKGYKTIAQENPKRVKIIDASQPINYVFDNIKSELYPKIKYT